MTEARATRILDIPTVTQGRSTIAVTTVGPNADPILLTSSGGGPGDLIIHHVLDQGSRLQRVEIPDPGLLYPAVQPLGSDQWLLIGTRADDEDNAKVFDQRGRPLRSFHVGDGIESVQVSGKGEIWIAYFDEGVFGEYELSAQGAVCVNANGQPVFRYHEQANLHGLPWIADCYAMNVCSNGDTWLFYYDGFPLVRITNGEVTDVIANTPPAAHFSTGLAVHEDRILFGGRHGGENPDSNTLVLYSARTGPAKELLLRGPAGERLSYQHAFGRDSLLYVATPDALLAVDLRDL